jgi:hypothetical protein
MSEEHRPLASATSPPATGSGGPGRDRAPLTPGTLLDGRWEVLEPLGRGGFGQVYRGRDAFGGAVAIKVVHAGWASSREIAALRALGLPNVVRYLGEGAVDGLPYVVADLVRGGPFPNTADRRWPALAERLLALFEALGRVHDAGFVHGDIKPDNVLADDDGVVTLIDFGLARHARQAAPADGDVVGTPSYLAPEQLYGAPADPRSDLYAAALVAIEALTGRRVFWGRSWGSLAEEREAPEVSALDGCAPDAVVEILRQCIAPDRRDRPRSAREVAAVLERAASALREPVSPSQLDGLFEGPDRLFHLGEDARAQLVARAGADPLALAAELASWRRAGLLRGRRIDRAALRYLQAQGAAGDGGDLLSRARQLGEDGHVEPARALLEAALHAALAEGAAAGGIALEIASLALAAMSAPALRSAAVDVRRVDPTDPDRVAAFCEAAVLALGEAGEPALAALDAARPARDELLPWWFAVRLFAARPCPVERERSLLEEAREALRRHPDAEGHLASWEGRLAYREERFADAARLQERAAALRTRRSARWTALLHAAGAWMEIHEHERAIELASRVREEASRARHPEHEGQAEWIVRSATWRSGRELALDLALLDSAALLSRPLYARVALCEAAVAWRSGHPDARHLAERARDAWRGTAMTPVFALLSSLVRASGGYADAAAIDSILATCPHPRIIAQARALLAGPRPSGCRCRRRAEILCEHEFTHAEEPEEPAEEEPEEPAEESHSPRP